MLEHQLVIRLGREHSSNTFTRPSVTVHKYCIFKLYLGDQTRCQDILLFSCPQAAEWQRIEKAFRQMLKSIWLLTGRFLELYAIVHQLDWHQTTLSFAKLRFLFRLQLVDLHSVKSEHSTSKTAQNYSGSHKYKIKSVEYLWDVHDFITG